MYTITRGPSKLVTQRRTGERTHSGRCTSWCHTSSLFLLLLYFNTCVFCLLLFAGPTQQLDNKINDFKHKPASWNVPE